MGEKVYDIRGQICPSTLLMVLKEVNEQSEMLKKGEMSLVFLTDNRDSLVTIPQSVETMGYRIETVKEKGHYRIRIRY
jgi:TusA-related sulfurtransferase